MEKKIESILIIGAGNVATHLANAFQDKVRIVGVHSKNNISSKILATQLNCPNIEHIHQFPTCDLILICVNDSSIQEVVSKIPNHFNIAYTSGSIELDSNSKNENLGVFYPLQTFSKESKLDISSVPFFIEGLNPAFSKKLFDLASLLSSQVSYATSTDRKKIHISAVIINNFMNHLAFLSKEYMEENGLNWNHLKPLIAETSNKIIFSSPYEVQTGPARRNDQQVIQDHLEMLKGHSKVIYSDISKSIIDTYSKKQIK